VEPAGALASERPRDERTEPDIIGVAMMNCAGLPGACFV